MYVKQRNTEILTTNIGAPPSRYHRHRLTDEQKNIMRKMWEEGATAKEIAVAFSVTPATVYRNASDGMRHFGRVTETEKILMRSMRESNESIRMIAKTFKYCEATVRKYVTPSTDSETRLAIKAGIRNAYMRNYSENIIRGHRIDE